MSAAQPGELREALTERLIPFVWSTGDVDAVLAEIMPRIAAWHEKEAERLARERAAEELRAAAEWLRDSDGWISGNNVARHEWMTARADALTADDQPVQP